MANNQSEFRRCLDLLSPSSPDDAKFAALMLIPRFLQQDNEKDVILVFEAMDFKFLERLMRTENLTEDNLPDYTLKVIAVHILSCFCVIEDLMKKKQLHALSVKQGLTRIVDSKTISHILQCVKNSTNVETRDISLQVIHHTTMGVITSIPTDRNFSDQKIIRDYLFIILSELSDIFRKNQDKFKFDLLELFVQMFSYITDKSIQDMFQNDISRTNVWVQNIRYGLKDILKSKIAILSFWSNLNSNTEIEKVNEEFKFAALVVQLACIEIKLMLDELSDQLENNKNYESVKRHEVILPACYTILEKTIEYLTKVEYMLDSKKKDELVDLIGVKLDPELLLRLKSSIESSSTLTDKATASIRILSVWLAEEGSLEKEVVTVIPFLLDFCRSSLNSQYAGVDLIKMLTPAFLNLTSQDKPLETFYFEGGPEMIINYFIKIWEHSKITNDIKDETVDDLLGPLQVLLNIVVLKREDFITKYKVELMKIIIIGRKISEILVLKLRSTGYSLQGNQIILLANTLLLCLLIISGDPSSSDLVEKDIIMSFINVATTFYEDQNNLSQNEIDVQVNELNLLGKQVLSSISSRI
ncbi:6767_t:CDS:10 [Diversispora eburnea]|uniref:6767_t:CDS:1 n=1 Tax=Diversispora eburnea TaxID=1213867 RepID=A0A9N9GAA8_9GLOM|nr:6767_t:CDS:10 [Diversispora eburnea]